MLAKKLYFYFLTKQNVMADILSEWYWVMPNKVLFSKELTDKQKLLYCLISSLCAKEWYCWASNKYLWEILWVKERTISNWIKTLIEQWFINSDINKSKGNERHITIAIVNNHIPYCEKSQDPYCEKSQHINTIYNITNNNYSFQDFRKDYPHARKWKKADSEKYFNQNDNEDVKKQVSILKWKIKAWLQDPQFIPACERRIRDFTPISEDVLRQDLMKICRWHLNEWWDIKQRAVELKETFWEQKINEIVKAIQQNGKSLF